VRWCRRGSGQVFPWRLLYGGRRASSMAYWTNWLSNYGDKVLIRPRTNSLAGPGWLSDRGTAGDQAVLLRAGALLAAAERAVHH